MQRITLNNKTYLIPASWKEVTVRQYVRIIKEWDPDEPDVAKKNWLILLNIFTGTKFEGMQEDWENQYTLTNTLGWVVFEPFKFSKELPKVLRFGRKDVEVSRSSGGLSIGQNIHLRRDYLDKLTSMEECISIATAIFLQPLIDGKKFSMERAKEIALEVDDMPIYLIHPIGFFLLRNAAKVGKPLEKQWRQTLSSLSMRFARTWRHLRK